MISDPAMIRALNSRPQRLAAAHPPEEIAAAALASADPFEIDHDCINPAGHQPIPSCGEVVCWGDGSVMTIPIWLLPVFPVAGMACGLALGWIAVRLTERAP